MLDLKFSGVQPLPFLHFKEVIQSLPKVGKVKVCNDGFSYLDIEDNFIHQVYPFIQSENVFKPEYFDPKTDYIGAHISITYPEECIDLADLHRYEGKEIEFSIQGLFAAEAFDKRYYALKVIAPELLKIRKTMGLTDKLSLKGFWVDLHITIAVQSQI